MESSEAEKAAILAELEESAGLGKERYVSGTATINIINLLHLLI